MIYHSLATFVWNIEMEYIGVHKKLDYAATDENYEQRLTAILD